MENKKINKNFSIKNNYAKNLIILFSVLFLFVSCSKKEKNVNLEENKNSEYMKTFTLDEISQGKKQWTMDASKATIQEGTTKIFIDKAHLTFFKNDKKVSYIESDTAIYDSKTKDIQSRGNVKMISFEENVVITTDTMDYFNSIGKFKSKDFVKITRDDSITTGTGFEANSDLSEINILNNVSITYKNDKN
jgi:LPS export ABC transporter protein LptC